MLIDHLTPSTTAPENSLDNVVDASKRLNAETLQMLHADLQQFVSGIRTRLKTISDSAAEYELTRALQTMRAIMDQHH